MADPRRRMRREDRRDELLRHAIDVFGRLGFRNATTSELARAAGVSEALLYQHFPSKQSLLVACIERIGDEFYTALEALLAAGQDDPARTFAGIVARLERFVAARPEIQRLSLVILAELEDDEIRTATRTMIEQNVELLARAIRRGQQRGVLRSDQNADGLAWLLVGMYQLFGVMQRLGNLDKLGAEALAPLAAAFLPPTEARHG